MTSAVRVAPGSPDRLWEVRVPGSKSITNRALLLAGVADGRSTLLDPLVADDTLAMAAALRTLGVGFEERQGADGGLIWGGERKTSRATRALHSTSSQRSFWQPE